MVERESTSQNKFIINVDKRNLAFGISEFNHFLELSLLPLSVSDNIEPLMLCFCNAKGLYCHTIHTDMKYSQSMYLGQTIKHLRLFCRMVGIAQATVTHSAITTAVFIFKCWNRNSSTCHTKEQSFVKLFLQDVTFR